MFIEKDRRYFRRYVIRIKARTVHAAPLPFAAKEGDWSILNALRKAVRNGKASAPQRNGDTIDLIKVEHDATRELLVLLFHRVSPNAADPAYRRRQANKLSLRQTKKEIDEEQAVSCHLVISTKLKDGTYPATLEEIPGLSASAVLGIVKSVLHDYKYPYKKGKESLETNTVFKAEGVKASSLTDALKKKGSLDYLTLTRTLPPDVPDAGGIAEPQTQRIRYKIVGDPAQAGWQKKFKSFIEGTKATWDHVSVDITLEDDRHRTVRIDAEKEAAEILFVRSDLVFIKGDLNPCTMKVVPAIVDAAAKLLKSS
ncbi:MAG TPA: hypothetical protein VF655_11565 [Allosphingosinicella sp.]|jgi:hypothetical protein